MRKTIRFFLLILGFCVLSFVLFLLYSIFTNYSPPDLVIISENKKHDTISKKDTLHFLIWNIGYAGLGSDMDFFYDGGKNTRTSKERTLENLNKISELLKSSDTIDFFMLQEVDSIAKRTYYINEIDSIKNLFPDRKTYFAMNYNVRFVPVPISSPMGKVISGITTYTKKTPKKCERIKFPGEGPFPTNLFMLDRCFMVMRYPTEDSHELLVINTHNAAFEDSAIKVQHMAYLKTFLIDEYNKGNYIIMGGDWNQSPPGANKNAFSDSLPENSFKLISITNDYLPEGWKWIFDPGTPTNRYLNFPYNENKTAKILIDYYLISPNVKEIYIKARPLNFQNSDHQPVFAGFCLN